MNRCQWPGPLRRLLRCPSGATAIEFALVAPILFLTLGMIVETGLFLTVQYMLQDATITAARQIRLGTVGPTSSATGAPNQMSMAGFKTLVCNELLNIIVPNCRTRIVVDARRAASFADLSQAMPQTPLAVGPQTAGNNYAEVFQPGASGEMGSLIVTFDWRFAFGNVAGFLHNVPGVPGVWRLTGVAVYRNEM